eukprot:SAG31_NODE_4257_length_3414_cov_1.764706_1_plen_283_part_00
MAQPVPAQHGADEVNRSLMVDLQTMHSMIEALQHEKQFLHQEVGGLRQLLQQSQDSASIVVSNLEAEQKKLAAKNSQHESDLKEIIGHAEALSLAVEGLEAELEKTRSERDRLQQQNSKLMESRDWSATRGHMAQMLAEQEEGTLGGNGQDGAEMAPAQPISFRLSNLSQRMRLANISGGGLGQPPANEDAVDDGGGAARQPSLCLNLASQGRSTSLPSYWSWRRRSCKFANRSGGGRRRSGIMPDRGKPRWKQSWRPRSSSASRSSSQTVRWRSRTRYADT